MIKFNNKISLIDNYLKKNSYKKLASNTIKTNLEIRPRYDYFNFINLLKNSKHLLTDGGSNQKEAYYLGKPCLLLREETVRKEGLGDNVVISELDEIKIQNFFTTYKSISKPIVRSYISYNKSNNRLNY